MYKEIYENLKRNNPDSDDDELRRLAWRQMNNRMYENAINNKYSRNAVHTGGSVFSKYIEPNYTENDFVE